MLKNKFEMIVTWTGEDALVSMEVSTDESGRTEKDNQKAFADCDNWMKSLADEIKTNLNIVIKEKENDGK